MAEQIGTMPCDTSGCTSEMSVMQDKRKKFYTNCVCGTNKRNSNIGQKLFAEAWEKFQENDEKISNDFVDRAQGVEDDINGVLVGGVPEDEPETIQETSEDKPNLIFPLFALSVIGGGVFAWLKKSKR